MTAPSPSNSIGRIDVHSHLLPSVDDGCKSVEESLACARIMVENGYTHSFCTPHVWPSNGHITVESVPKLTAELQARLNDAQIPLTLIPGGEINLRPEYTSNTPLRDIISFAMLGTYV